MDFGGLWGGITETWDVVYDAGQEVLVEAVQGLKESGKDTDALRASEPVKGSNTDGTPVVVKEQVGQAQYQSPILNGVDNTTLMVGAALLVGLLLVMQKG